MLNSSSALTVMPDTQCGHAHQLRGEAVNCARDTCPERQLNLAGIRYSDAIGMTPYETLCSVTGRI